RFGLRARVVPRVVRPAIIITVCLAVSVAMRARLPVTSPGIALLRVFWCAVATARHYATERGNLGHRLGHANATVAIHVEALTDCIGRGARNRCAVRLISIAEILGHTGRAERGPVGEEAAF